MKKICVITGTRAEYGLLYWLMKEIQSDSEFKLQVIVTGMHLSPEFGLTYKEVEKQFNIDKKIEMLLSSDTSVGISKSVGLATISFGEAFEELKPDLVIVLGDRYEVFAASSAATIANIPIAHLHGGETSEGAFDEAFRHSITKMSFFHFTANRIYRNRVIQLGENPDRVFDVGGFGLDNIKRLNLLSREELEESIGFKFKEKNLLVTFHPVTLENNSAENQINALLDALQSLEGTGIIFTKSNSDTNGRIINEAIDDFVSRNKENCIAFHSMGQLRYLSSLQFIDGAVGNSSSGLIEVPGFFKGTVNIGDRQSGRLKADSVIDCEPDTHSIRKALEKLYSDEFQNLVKTVKNPYGNGGASKKTWDILKSRMTGINLKKRFYDIKTMDGKK